MDKLKAMRRKFGPMCDAPSPREYVDIALTSAEAIREVVEAVNIGRDAMVGVVCRTIKREHPPSLLCVKGLKRAPGDDKPMYR